MTLEIAAASDTGRVRAHNEDALHFNARARYAVLADGLGGYNAGEVASRMAVEIVSSTVERALEDAPRRALDPDRASRVVAEAIVQANEAIYSMAATRSECTGMGTTIVAALWLEERLVAAHVGDSRLYRRRGDTLVQLTHDHSLVQESIDRGLIPRSHAQFAAGRAIVTRAVGTDAHVEPEVRSFDVTAQDVYLLCSDGLTDMLKDAEIEAILSPARRGLQDTADTLVNAANEKGGRDNISVILARIGSAEPPC